MLTPQARKRLRQLEFISRRQVDDSLQGRYASLFKGKGLEFAEVREYVPGDDVRYLDWNVTARFGKPFVKRNVEERELTIMLLLDGSASMGEPEHIGSKADLAAQLVALLSFAALRFGHKVGLLRFGERVERYVAPQRGHQHIMRLLGEVFAYRPSGRGTDLLGALNYFNRIFPRRAVVFVLSDLLTPGFLPSGSVGEEGKSSQTDKLGRAAEVEERSLRLACRRHDLSVLRLVAPLERELPAVGRVRWADAETGQIALIDTSHSSMRQCYARLAQERSERWRRAVERCGGSYAEFCGGDDVVALLLSFMNRKRLRRGGPA